MNDQSGINSLSPSIDVSLRGEKAATAAVRDEIEARLSGLKQWYSVFSPDHDAVAFGLFLVTAIVTFFATGFLIVKYSNLSASPTSMEILGFGFQWIGILMAVLFLKKRLFPKLLFDIGRSSNQIKRVTFWRVGICGAVLLGVAINLLSDRLTK